MQGVFLYVGDSPPAGSPSDGWVWIDTANKVVMVYQGYADGSWVETPLNIVVGVTMSGNLRIDGDVQVGDDAGITGSKTVGGYKITFKKGLLTGFEAV